MADSPAKRTEILLLLDGEVLAEIDLDSIQDDFPWYEGTLIEGPSLPRWRDFVRAFHDAHIDRDYCPHHPDEGPFEDTDLAKYIHALTALRDARAADRVVPEDEDDTWLAPWRSAPLERLEAYLGFLDWRRWSAVTHAGELIEEIPLPPSLDLDTKRFAFRM